MKAFTRHGRESADHLAEGLARIAGADVKVALTHFSPVDDTLVGEPPEIWAFLGNYLLAEAIDRAGADLAVHGHAHAGCEKGVTAGGVRVRNVAQPVIGAAYAIYEVHGASVPTG
jgi:Icc-related predicted phosphoesterase